MNCDGVRAAAADFRAGKLAEQESARVAAHLDGCAACERAVEAFGALFEALPVPRVDLAAKLSRQLEAQRGEAARGPSPALRPAPAAAVHGAWRTAIAPAFAVAALAALIVLAPGTRPVDGRAGRWEGGGAALATGARLVARTDLSLVDPSGNIELKLTAGSRIARDARGIQLEEGQVGLSIATGTSPGFTVTAGDVIVTVSGTRFTVTRTAGTVRVALVDGGTHVSLPGAPERRMVPGQVLTVAPGGAVSVEFMKADERARTAGWVGGARRME